MFVWWQREREREKGGMMGKGVIMSTAANGQYKYKHTVKIN